MVLILGNSENDQAGYGYSGLFTCALAIMILMFSTLDSRADTSRQYLATERGENNFLNENAKVELFTTERAIYLPYDEILQFSGNIYAIRGYNIFSSFIPRLEVHKNESFTGLGITGTVKWPLVQKRDWGIHIRGKVSSSRQSIRIQHRRNRWNFEHQLGGGANYHFNDIVELSLSAYHYRIINDFIYDNPAQSYISSSGGFATLQFQF